MNKVNQAVSSAHINFIDYLVQKGTIKSKFVEQVLKTLDRGDFTNVDPYKDCPQGIGYSATISAPHMHIYALEYLEKHLVRAKTCLDVGSGSGYLTLAFAKMMQQQEAVSYGIEHIPQLVTDSIKNISKNHKDWLTGGKVVIQEGDGRKGLKNYAPYDCIHVGAAAEQIPQELINQLANGGRMLIPVGKPGNQDFMVIDKDEKGNLFQKVAFGVTYVPLTDKQKQVPGLF